MRENEEKLIANNPPNVLVLCKEFVPSETLIKVLEKGLTFIPTPAMTKNHRLELEYELQKYHRRIELDLYFKDDKRRFDKKNISNRFKNSSEWRPPAHKLPPQMATLIQKDQKTLKLLNLQERDPYMNPRKYLNISEEEKRELLTLKWNHNVVVKKADKGNAVVLMDRTQYVKEATRQLEDPIYYKPLKKPLFPKVMPIVRSILDSLVTEKFISKKQRTYLIGPPEPRVRRFYILPKIHKEQSKWTVPGEIPPGRPIVSDCSSDTYGTAELLEFYLNPLSQGHASYVKDTTHFISLVKELHIPTTALFFTIDIDSLYTNIPIKEGIEAVREIFQKNPNPRRPDRQLIQLLYINLTKNDFEFNGKYYLQIHGTSMGKRLAPSYANIFMAKWETEVHEKCPIKPLIYLRFLDDIFGVWVHSEEEFKQYLNTLNTFYPTIKIKHTQSYQQVDFLDTTVFKGPDFGRTHKVDVRVFFKETDTHALLHASSYHPHFTWKGIVKSQLIRFHRICTRKEDFFRATRILFKALRKRGYKRPMLRQSFNSFLEKAQHEQTTKIPLITTYSHSTKGFNPKVKENFEEHILSHGLLPRHAVINAFRKNDNLSQILVRASLPQPKKPLKPSPCSRAMTHLKLVKSKQTGRIYPILHTFNHDTKNCVYLVFCKQCGQQYVGETKNKLRTRFTQHRYNLYNRKKLDTPLVRHFLTVHRPWDFKIAGLERCDLWTDKQRKKTELQWIYKLQTRQPFGLNLKRSLPKSQHYLDQGQVKP